MAWREKANFGRVDTQDGVVLPVYTVATLPTVDVATGQVVVCTDGNAGSKTLAYYDGTNWIASATGATAAAS